MTRLDAFRQSTTAFDRFLYASVGKDRNENVVTVLSALARRGVDPWDEALDLSKLTHEKARSRLTGILVQFRDVPSLADDLAPTIRRLVDLLP